MTEPSVKKIEAWMEEGFEVLRLGETITAARLGRRLIKHRHTSGFEILAQALYGDQELDEAVKILEEGVERAPGVWLLWQLLGNYRSERCDYEGAQEAYQSALKCEHVDADSVNYNIAVAFDGEGRTEDAIRALGQIGEGTMKPRAAALHASILAGQGCEEEAIQLAHLTLESMDAMALENDENSLYSPESYASTYALLGQTLRLCGELDTARRCFQEGLWLDQTERSVLTLLRDINNAYSQNAKYFRVLVEGEWPKEASEDEEDLRFFKTFDVVAQSPDVILDWIKTAEMDATHNTLHIEEIEELEERPNDPMGVYRATAYHLFPREEDLAESQ